MKATNKKSKITNPKYWKNYFKKLPLLQHCLEWLKHYDERSQIKYTIEKESYWDKF